MPLYEYYCPHCDLTFEKLRPFSQAEAPMRCPECQGEDTRRMISVCASLVAEEGGSVRSPGGGGCAGCAGGSCATCHH